MLYSRNIRTKLGRYRFLREMKKVERKPEVVSFDEAMKIGLLYDATDERDSDSESSDCEETSDSEESEASEELEGEILDYAEAKQVQVSKERNWWDSASDSD